MLKIFFFQSIDHQQKEMELTHNVKYYLEKPHFKYSNINQMLANMT